MPALKLINTVALLAASLLLSACFPVYKTLQPYAEAQVFDESGKKLSGAKTEVALISSASPYGYEQFRTVVHPGPAGIARFYKVKDFRFESLTMHGIQAFSWSWCVRSKGYETVTKSYRSDGQFEPYAQFKLKPGVSTACPMPQY
ncbi:hypothetical protein NNO07_23130 [Pseudomonas resinovorans]|uniref:Lipoprotein n=1 Tax=Metapseudomonas resinovorans TaxID=53412 RepID=A0ABT4YB22_METRE|nr:hypothetical protein [Pseudomonas resinovorans]MDA8485968.1 hypothetical protein [Pseudomonas resinovorans]